MLKLESAKIKFTKGDIRSQIRLPTKVTKELAYETGVQIGDGCLSYYRRKNPSRKIFLISFTGNLENEIFYYENFLKPLIFRLYGKKINVWKHFSDNTCNIQFQSRAIFDFKTKILGLQKSPKSEINIPGLFIRNKNILLSCIRGLFDTDFSLVFQRKYKTVKYYPKIRGTSKSKILIKQLKDILENEFNFKTVTEFDVKRFDKRTGKFYVSNALEIYGKAQVERFMNFIGTSNNYINRRYKIWKHFGYLDDALVAQTGRVY